MDNRTHTEERHAGATLTVAKHHSAIYWDKVVCRLNARLGKIGYDEAEILDSYAFRPSPGDCALEVVGLTDEEVTFVVPALYRPDRTSTVDTIRRGETKLHAETHKGYSSWEGDEWDYEVENRLEVRWE